MLLEKNVDAHSINHDHAVLSIVQAINEGQAKSLMNFQNFSLVTIWPQFLVAESHIAVSMHKTSSGLAF